MSFPAAGRASTMLAWSLALACTSPPPLDLDAFVAVAGEEAFASEEDVSERADTVPDAVETVSVADAPETIDDAEPPVCDTTGCGATCSGTLSPIDWVEGAGWRTLGDALFADGRLTLSSTAEQPAAAWLEASPWTGAFDLQTTLDVGDLPPGASVRIALGDGEPPETTAGSASVSLAIGDNGLESTATVGDGVWLSASRADGAMDSIVLSLRRACDSLVFGGRAAECVPGLTGEYRHLTVALVGGTANVTITKVRLVAGDSEDCDKDCNEEDCQGELPLCVDWSCTPLAGCGHAQASNGTPCDTTTCLEKQCVDGVCQTIGDTDCDDNDSCTDDSCDSVLGCENTPTDCDDNDSCTDDTCDSVLGCQTAPTSCDDNDSCTDDSCDTLLGCQTAPTNCDDDDSCTDDSCDSLLGCETTPTDCDDAHRLRRRLLRHDARLSDHAHELRRQRQLHRRLVRLAARLSDGAHELRRRRDRTRRAV